MEHSDVNSIYLLDYREDKDRSDVRLGEDEPLKPKTWYSLDFLAASLADLEETIEQLVKHQNVEPYEMIDLRRDELNIVSRRGRDLMKLGNELKFYLPDARIMENPSIHTPPVTMHTLTLMSRSEHQGRAGPVEGRTSKRHTIVKLHVI